MTFSSAGAARTKTKTRLPAGRTVPRRVQRGRGHQLWRAVLGNPIPIKTVNYYPVTRVDSTDGTDNSNDTAPSTALANGMRAPLFGFRRATSSGESDRTNGRPNKQFLNCHECLRIAPQQETSFGREPGLRRSRTRARQHSDD